MSTIINKLHLKKKNKDPTSAWWVKFPAVALVLDNALANSQARLHIFLQIVKPFPMVYLSGSTNNNKNNFLAKVTPLELKNSCFLTVTQL